MKIEGNPQNQNVGPIAQERINESRTRPAGTTETSGPAHGDTVQLSSQARLVDQALRAASTQSPVRADKVESVKQKLAAGEIGQDAGRLADRLIDHLLEE